ncbi:aldo/keto reductase [Faecalicatena sp. AGMB00832]|uniref:Aldo/keto reductase n=1 Tax=Faecalicatena faecalis TaxID=2726362 RepID=A0ABS6D4L4_9FIRM|nr:MULTISPECIES: aldo/keto reductase [Faecalicatena]MBU3876434.1 aldo/keto reductase [Faecalicatena faecalis]MCI6465431.1 aldo/keto reductase [Faecalicatena sp.]MDY5617263.1 aldo/keto reductase [Lachnospiraceae bacterium]
MYLANEKRYQGMIYNRCGQSGLKLPLLSLGLWHNFGACSSFDNMRNMCITAFDEGITHFDLANNYGPYFGSAEENFGRILNQELRSYRDELVISTKAGYDMWDGPYGSWGSRKHLIASLEQSLKRMNCDYVDIFYHHRMDKTTPLEETMDALAYIVKSGKALYIGISNYDKEYTKKAAELLNERKCPCIVNQRRYSIFDRTIEEDGVKEYAHQNGIGIVAFSPLAQGLLTDKYLNGIPESSRIARDPRFLKPSSLTEKKLFQIRQLNEIARKRGQTLAQMSLAWILKDDEICSALIGASAPCQIRENLEIINNHSFSEEELRKIDEISKEIQ